MAEKELSFISGLIGGFGQTVLENQQKKKAEKLKTLQVLIDSPEVDDESRQKALDELVGMTGLSPKGKTSKQFQYARGMMQGIVKIGRGIAGAQKKIQGQGQGQDQQGAGLGDVPQRGGQSQSQSPFRIKTTGQLQQEQDVAAARKAAIERQSQEEQDFDKRMQEDQDRQRRKQVAKDYGISGAAAAEFVETGKITAGMLGKVTQGKDAYENPPGSGHWVRDIIDTQSGEVVGQVPAQSPVKPSKFDQEADALLRAGKAKDPEQAYQMATDRVYEESKKKVADINSRIAARTSTIQARNAGLPDLTKAEKAEIDSLKTEMQITARSLDREKALQQKEATTERKKTHDAEIQRLTDDIDDLEKQISDKLAAVKERTGTDIPARLPQGGGKELTDKATAQKFMDAAGGDPKKAQELAEKNGWKVLRK